MANYPPKLTIPGLTLALMLFFSPGSKHHPAVAATNTGSTTPFSDLTQLRQELHRVGPLKFYDATEELMRAAQFEPALIRYRLLQGQIAGQRAYTGLTALIHHRLRFLQQQLQLRDWEVEPLAPAKRRAAKRRPAKKAAPTSPPAPHSETAPPAKGVASPTSTQTTPEPPPPTVSESAAPPPATPAPDGLPQKPGPPSHIEEQAQADQPPPPPPGTWEKISQKLKKRLFFWNNKKDSG